MRRLSIAVVVILGMVHSVGAGGVSQAGPAPAGGEEDCQRTASARFVFHNDPWINLHHFLFQWARNYPERMRGDRRRAVELTETGQLEGLPAEERQAWERALELYRDRIVQGNLLFDRDLVAMRGDLAAISCTGTGLEGIDADLRAVLPGAMTVYRQRWWPAHQEANASWIRAELHALDSYEATLARRLAEAYGGGWPEEGIRVDVVAYANWAGGYTTNHPDHVTVSSSYEGVEGVEILFHEVSHASFFEQRILRQLAEAFRPHGIDPPDRLSHVIQFVTPAELVLATVDGAELDGYRTLAAGVYDRSRARNLYEIVLEQWRPFLEGATGRDEALAGIAARVARQEHPD